jgi:small subunit ribosomal protein S7
MEVRSKRVGGATYQVPMKVSRKRSLSLSMRWITGTAKAKKGKAMSEKLSEELIGASKNEGEAIKKKENMHKMAKANKAFAYLAK